MEGYCMTVEPKIVSLSLLNTKEFLREITDSQSSFNKYNKGFIATHGELLKRMKDQLGEGKTVPIEDLGITLKDLKDLKAGAYNLWLEINVLDSKGKEVKVDSREFIAWQREAPGQPIDVWTEAKKIELVSKKEQIVAKDATGEQKLNIEWHKGKRRIVDSFRAILSQERDGHYGEVVLPAPNGKPVRNKDGLPDIFLTDDVYKQIKNDKKPYRGPVIVKDLYNNKGKFVEVKIFFGTETQKASEDIEASSFVTRKAFENYNGKSPYHKISHAQFQAWEYDVSKHPENASISFKDWVTKNWGSKERFDGIFANMKPITKEQYEEIAKIAAGPDMKLGTTDDLSAKDVMEALEKLKKDMPLSNAPSAMR